MRRRIMGIARRLPYSVKITASYALPFNSIWCPGRTERAESSSGAPRKIDGMKSRNVWVIDIEITKIARISGEK